MALMPLTLLWTVAVSAQSYPTKPIRLIVPYPQGGCPGSRRGGWGWGGDGRMPPGLWQIAQRWLAIAFVLLSLLWTVAVIAQPYPSKPIRLIVPYPPGGCPGFFRGILACRGNGTISQPFCDDHP